MSDTHLLCSIINAYYLVKQFMTTTNLSTYCSR